MSDVIFDLSDSIRNAEAELKLLKAIKDFNFALKEVQNAVENFENTTDRKYNYRTINEYAPFLDYYPFQVSLDDVSTNWGDIKIEEEKS